jgi:hypothetical protein
MLGATNGLAQTVVSVQRSVGPVIAAWPFSFSLEKNVMGGYGVFYVLTLCTLGGHLACIAAPTRYLETPGSPEVVSERGRRPGK